MCYTALRVEPWLLRDHAHHDAGINSQGTRASIPTLQLVVAQLYFIPNTMGVIFLWGFLTLTLAGFRLLTLDPKAAFFIEPLCARADDDGDGGDSGREREKAAWLAALRVR